MPALGTPAELYYKGAAKSMGKRELLLIAGFLILGAVVYQATAPPAGPNERSFSISRLVDHIRREVRGNRASAEVTTTRTHAIARDVTELRVDGAFAEVTIVGEERADVETSLRVHSNAYDEAEAKQTAQDTVLLVDRAGATISFRSKYPQPGRQRAFLAIKVPARLRLRVESSPSQLDVTALAAVEVPSGRFEATFTRIAGAVDINQRGGSVKLEDVGSVKMSGRGSDVAMTRVRGEVSISMQGGELEAAELAGPIDIDATSADIGIRKAEHTRGPVRINATAGTISVEGLQADARIDGRNAEIEVAMAGAAPLAIYNEGDERVEVTLPPGSYTLDARASNGRITVPEDLQATFNVEQKGDPNGEQRAYGPAKGGGPTITLRANHGSITLLSGDARKSER